LVNHLYLILFLDLVESDQRASSVLKLKEKT